MSSLSRREGPSSSLTVAPLGYSEVDPALPRTTGSEASITLTQQELALREAQAREQGRQQSAVTVRAEMEQQIAQARAQVASAIAGFAQERATYYEQVEREVVQLALSIARKVLHREAQVDPLLLVGIVRVALEQMGSGTEVLVRVHPAQASSWKAYLAQAMDPRNLPRVIEDPEIDESRCVLQTLLGTTEIGLEVQLKEIERGLADLLAQRPRTES